MTVRLPSAFEICSFSNNEPICPTPGLKMAMLVFIAGWSDIAPRDPKVALVNVAPPVSTPAVALHDAWMFSAVTSPSMESTGNVTVVAEADAVSDPAFRSATEISAPVVRIPGTVVAVDTVAEVGPDEFVGASGPTSLGGCPTRVIATCAPNADAEGSEAEAGVLPMQIKKTGSIQI